MILVQATESILEVTDLVNQSGDILKEIVKKKIGINDFRGVKIGRDGDNLVIILGGGTKKRQQRDITAAKAYWQDYKARKH